MIKAKKPIVDSKAELARDKKMGIKPMANEAMENKSSKKKKSNKKPKVNNLLKAMMMGGK